MVMNDDGNLLKQLITLTNSVGDNSDIDQIYRTDVYL